MFLYSAMPSMYRHSCASCVPFSGTIKSWRRVAARWYLPNAKLSLAYSYLYLMSPDLYTLLNSLAQPLSSINGINAVKACFIMSSF